MHQTYNPREQFDLTPQQYHAGLDKLWGALGVEGVQDEDVFTLCAREIRELRTARNANRQSMELMWKLLRILLPHRKNGCLCDGCICHELNERDPETDS